MKKLFERITRLGTKTPPRERARGTKGRDDWPRALGLVVAALVVLLVVSVLVAWRLYT